MDPQERVESVLELIWRILLRIVIWVGLGYFFYRVRSVAGAILVAVVLCYMLLPSVDFLCSYRVRGLSRKFQRLVATLLVFIMLFSGIIVTVKACIRPFQNEFMGVVSNLDASKLNTTVEKTRRSVAAWVKQFSVLNDALPDDVRNFLYAPDDNAINSRLGGDRGSQKTFVRLGSAVRNWTTNAAKSSIGYLFRLVDLILIPVLAFYFILDSRTLKKEFVALAPRRRTKEVLGMLHEVNDIMRSYVVGQIILCVIAGVVVGLLLRLFDMDYVLILSLFAGITRAIPVVGPVVSGAAIVVLAMAKTPTLGLYILIAFSIMHFVESKFIMPKLIGDRMHLHPAVVLIALLIGAEFFGILGMFMAAPVAAIIRVLVRYYLIKPKRLHVWGLTHEEHVAYVRPAEPASSTSGENQNTFPSQREDQ